VFLSSLVLVVLGCGGGGKPSTLHALGATPEPVTTAPEQPAPEVPAPEPGLILGEELPVEPTPEPDPILPPRSISPVSNNLGICVGWSGFPSSEWDLIAAGGFKVVRFDMLWSAVEKQRGVYSFMGEQLYDSMVATLEARGVRMIFILDYGNPLYDGGYAPYSDEGRAAFAKFAAAAAERYRGKNIIWEIWNEPNEPGFWKLAPGNHETISSLYGKLVQRVIPAMRAADPNAYIVGPAVSNLNDGDLNYGALPFIRELGRINMLREFNAISVHSYRRGDPETASADYTRLRAVMGQYGAFDKPILDTEVGRSTGFHSNGMPTITAEQQGGWLVRTFLTDMANDIDLTVWYTWKNHGSNPSLVGDNWGVVTQSGQPKQVYVAAKTLAQTLNGYKFSQRISGTLSGDKYLYEFQNGGRTAYAFWKTTPNIESTTIPLPIGSWKRVDTFGNVQVVTSSGNLTTTVTSMPVYFIPN